MTHSTFDHYSRHVVYGRQPALAPALIVRDADMHDFERAELAQRLRTEPAPPQEFLDEWLSVPANLPRAEPFAFQRRDA